LGAWWNILWPYLWKSATYLTVSAQNIPQFETRKSI
jgi:hypothetical protein